MRVAAYVVLSCCLAWAGGVGATAVAGPAAARFTQPVRLLTLEDAVSQALMHQPQILASRAEAAAAAARVGQSRAALLPQVVGTLNYARSTANFVLRPGSLPASVHTGSVQEALSNHSYNYINGAVSGQQLIYDFGQSWGTWSAAQHKEVAQNANQQATALIVVFGVRNAFFVARAQKEFAQVAAATLHNQGRHRAQTQGFVQVGTQPKIALAQANTDFASAKVQLITAENNYASAKANLNQAMGLEDDLDYDVTDDSLEAVVGEQAGMPALMQEALARRPEFVAAAELIRAQQDTLSSLRGTFGPSLNATAQVTDAGVSLSQLGWNWAAGLSLNWPLFSGGLNYQQIVEAEATLRALQAQQAATRAQIRLELEAARLGLRAALATVEASEDVWINAQQQLALAQGRYETGIGGMIEWGDAQVAQSSAAAQRVQARFQLAQARAALLKGLARPP